MESGIVNNRLKKLDTGKTVFTFALGDRELYEFMNDNPCIEGRPVSYVNDPRVISQQDRFVSINSTLEIDLTGQCNSECLGGYQYSGAGGQVDFVRGAFASRGGKSIMVLNSTASDGTVTRIVPRLHGPVTTVADGHALGRHRARRGVPQGQVRVGAHAGADLDRRAAVSRRAAVPREADALGVSIAGERIVRVIFIIGVETHAGSRSGHHRQP